MLSTAMVEGRVESKEPSAPALQPDGSIQLTSKLSTLKSLVQNIQPNHETKSDELVTVDESIVLNATSHTLELPQVDFVRPPARVPDEDKDPETDPVRELKPDYNTFGEIRSGDFVKAPDTHVSFIEWAESKDIAEDWIRKPNAINRDDLLKAINGKNQGGRSGIGRDVKVGVASFFTLGVYTLSRSEVLMPGQIYFTNNQGTQEIIVLEGNESKRQTLLTPLKSWDGNVSENVAYCKNKNITIVNIPPGHVGFAEECRQPVLLLPGRHAYNNANFLLEEKNIVDIRSVDFRKTFFNNLSIIRIQPTEIGIAEINSSPFVLLPGLHIQRDANFKFIKALDTRDLQSVEAVPEQKRQRDHQPHIYTHGPLSIIQVNRDQMGFAMTKEGPVVLSSGVYLRKDGSFNFGKFVDANAQYKHFNSIHMLDVRPNQVALVWINNRARVLGEGHHQFNTRSFIFEPQKFINLYEQDAKNSKELLLRHGNYTIFRIASDEYGYGFEVKTGTPKRIKPGFYQMNSLDFIFEKRENVSATHEYKGIHHVVVDPGMAQVITLADGTQRTLLKGTHNFTAPNAILSKPIDMKETVLVLHQKRVTLADKTPLLVTGQISYQVTDPIKLINKVGQDILKEYFDLNVDADLRQAFQSKNSSMLTHSMPTKTDESKRDKRAFGSENTVEGDQLRGDICADIMSKLKHEVEPWGVNILEVRISDMLLEKEAQEELAKATLKARTTEAQLVIQQGENATAQEKELGAIQRRLEVERKNAEILAVTTKAQTEAKLQEAKQMAEADAIKKTVAAKADAEVKAALAQAEADAEAKKIRYKADAEIESEMKRIAAFAKAQADAKLAAAEAEAKAISLIGRAKAEAMKLEAEALKAKNEATIQVPEYLQLEQLRALVEQEKARATRQTPAVVMGGEAQRTMDGMFFGDGLQLIKYGLKQHGQFRPRRNSTPAAGVASKEVADFKPAVS